MLILTGTVCDSVRLLHDVECVLDSSHLAVDIFVFAITYSMDIATGPRH